MKTDHTTPKVSAATAIIAMEESKNHGDATTINSTLEDSAKTAILMTITVKKEKKPPKQNPLKK